MSFATEHFDRLPDSAHVRTGTVASVFGVCVATVRMWERKGLLPPATVLPTRRLAWRVSEIRRALRTYRGSGSVSGGGSHVER